MTGPEHYAEAERLLTEAEDFASDSIGERSILATAQVHATLALAASTIDAAAHPGQSQVDYLGGWFEVIA